MCLLRTPGPGPIGRAGGAEGLSKIGRIAEAVRRAARFLPGESGAKLQALLTPEALASVVVVLGLWVASHAFGLGEAIDLLLLATGFIFVGREALDALDHLAAFARLATGSGPDSELDQAGRHLAQAVSIIGIDAVIALLTRGALRAQRGRYRPTVKGDPALPAGEGWTNKYGDITYSTAGSPTEQALVLYHEQVHSLLSPKLMALREQRADFGMAGYQNSALLRYLEEALAETYAQLRVNGIKGLPAGVRFPIANGYVSLRAVATEASIGAAGVTIVIGGIVFVVDIEAARP